MKTILKKTLAGAAVAVLFLNFNANAQTWNIPGATTTDPGYFGVTGGATTIGSGYEALNSPRLVVQNKGNGTANYGSSASFLLNSYASTSSSIIPVYRVNILDRFPGIGSSMISGASYNGTQWVTLFSVNWNGYVTIGDHSVMTIPAGGTGTFKLAVQGGIITEKVKIALSSDATNWSWPDYVFRKDYRLLPLNELESYINKNKHLPEVPSEAEVKKDGLDVADMDAMLLKKIEELTLYMINMQKEIDLLKEENKKLQTGKN